MKRYATYDTTQRVTLYQICQRTGLTEHRVRMLLMKKSRILRPDGRGDPRTYDAQVIERIRAYLGMPSEATTPPDNDWLVKYQKGNT